MLLERAQSCVLLIDVQEKLTPYVMQPEALVNRCHWLMELAEALRVNQFVSEQYPSGLGTTVRPLQALLSSQKVYEKVHFSCLGDASIKEKLRALDKKQIVLIGIETHVCVLQTALDLLLAGYGVFVVVDAVSSRHELDHHYGLKRMKQAGAELVTSEMVFFEWLKQAGTKEFKDLSKRFFKDTL